MSVSNHDFTGLAINGMVCACGPSLEEIKILIAEVPLKKRNELKNSYDTKLLQNIDNLHKQGQPTANAIAQSHEKTWKDVEHDMPEKRKDWQGEQFVVAVQAEERLNQSRIAHTRIMPLPIVQKIGNSIVTTTNEVPQVYYTYRAEFRNELAKELSSSQS